MESSHPGRDYHPRPFRPARWLPGPHAQTAAGRILRPVHPVGFRRERLETPDGDFVDLDFAGWPEHGTAGFGATLILHGLEGSSRSAYVLQSVRELAAAELPAVVLNFRSCSGEPNRAARFYNAGDTEDLAHVVRHLRERYPGIALTGLGFSLGGNVLLKYLGEQGDGSPIRAAVAVSVPFDLVDGSRMLRRPAGRVYARLFLRSLQRKVAGKREMLADRCEVDRALAARTLHEFDDAATARIHGFPDADTYYRDSSSARFLSRIRVPTLLLHAADDPFLSPAALPHGAVAANPALTAVFTDRGGHVGFVGGTPWRPTFWAEREAARYLSLALQGANVPAAGRVMDV
jgi:uncharacterized protein